MLKKYKKAFSIAFIILSALIMLVILFKNDDLFNLFEIIKNINTDYIIIALSFIFIFWLLEAAMIYLLADYKIYRTQKRFRHLLVGSEGYNDWTILQQYYTISFRGTAGTAVCPQRQ